MQITEQQIAFIMEDIQQRGVYQQGLVEDLADHICCAVEAHPGSDFDSVYAEVIRSFGDEGLISVQEETILLLTIKKEETMKKLMYVLGFIATTTITSGMMFKILHWPGANVLMLTGTMLLNFGFLPMYFYHKYKSSLTS